MSTARSDGRGIPQRRRYGNSHAGGTAANDVTPHGTARPVSRPAGRSVHAPLHAALDYRARRLYALLDDVRQRDAALAAFDPASAQLLRWWCATDSGRVRSDNFNHAQRVAIMHTLIAHALLRSDDPATLCRRACAPDGDDTGDAPPVDARYRLRLAPGSGRRWVLQALLIWRWAVACQHGAPDAGAGARAGSAAATGDLRLQLLARTPGLRDRLQAAIFGTTARGIDDASVLRHARLFLPPAWRTDFRAWLQTAASNGALRIAAADSTALPGPFRLIATEGTRRLQIDLLDAEAIDEVINEATAPLPAAAAALADVSLAEAIRHGACKLPVLAPLPVTGAPLPAQPPRHPGLRPRLSRMHHRLLQVGLAALAQRDGAFVALDPARRPRLLVLCATPTLRRAARRWLIDAGIAREAFAIAGDAALPAGARVVFDTLPPQAVAADARICAVVALRDHRDAPSALRVAMAIAAAGAASLWPEPDFAELRHENIERAVQARPPRHLIDALTIADDPRCHRDYVRLPQSRLPADPVPAADDLFPVPLREDAACFDLRLPAPPCSDGPAAPLDGLIEGLTGESAGGPAGTPAEGPRDPPRRILRRRHALAVRKSVLAFAPCGAHDGGLRRGFLECAEADPEIESHCLLDPRRHGARSREALLARGLDARGWPDALVRTADRVYLVEFLPFCPTRPLPPTPGERAVMRWLGRVAALPAALREERHWWRVCVPAPVFWSWKRSGGSLGGLLSMLVDAASPPPEAPSVPTRRTV